MIGKSGKEERSDWKEWKALERVGDDSFSLPSRLFKKSFSKSWVKNDLGEVEKKHLRLYSNKCAFVY